MVLSQRYQLDSAHRKQLKHDKFVDQVGHSVEYAATHRDQMIKWGGAALAVVVLVAGVYWYMNYQHGVRQAALRNAMQTYEAGVGTGGSEFVKTFATQEEKDKAVVKELTEVANKYEGKEEGQVARYFLGLHYADKGKMADAEKNLKPVAESGKDDLRVPSEAFLGRALRLHGASSGRGKTSSFPHQ